MQSNSAEEMLASSKKCNCVWYVSDQSIVSLSPKEPVVD